MHSDTGNEFDLSLRDEIRVVALQSLGKTKALDGRDSLLKLSIVIPVWNEIASLDELICRVEQIGYPKEILIIDDGSTDGSIKQVEKWAAHPEITALYHPRNLGKGAAIRTAVAKVTGDIVIIQDADLEYDPGEIERLIAPLLAKQADVVFGSRFLQSGQSACNFQRRLANRFLTWLSNRFTGLRLTDMETCYKAMRSDVLCSISIQENRFGVEPELTAKIARGGWRVVEVPISYAPRDYISGKKIGFRDGLRAIWCILRYSRWD